MIDDEEILKALADLAADLRRLPVQRAFDKSFDVIEALREYGFTWIAIADFISSATDRVFAASYVRSLHSRSRSKKNAPPSAGRFSGYVRSLHARSKSEKTTPSAAGPFSARGAGDESRDGGVAPLAPPQIPLPSASEEKGRRNATPPASPSSKEETTFQRLQREHAEKQERAARHRISLATQDGEE